MSGPRTRAASTSAASISRCAIEAGSRVHGAGEVAPLRELPGRPAQPIDRTIVVRRRRDRRSARRTPSGGSRAAPAASGRTLVEEARRGGLGQHLEERIDAGFDRPLAQQVGAEAVDGADVRLLETGQRVDRAACASPERGRGAARAIEPLAQPQLQLAGGLLGERHRDDLSDRRPAFGEDRDDPPDQLGRLARCRRRPRRSACRRAREAIA